MRKIIAFFVVMAMLISILPTSLADNYKTMDNKSTSTFPQANDVYGEKEIPSVNQTEGLSSGIGPNSVNLDGEVKGNPTKGTQLYAFDWYPSMQWFSMNSDDPTVSTYHGSTTTNVYWAAEYFQGTIYAVWSPNGGGANVFGTIDPETFETTEIAVVEATQALAMDYYSATMYAMCQGTLYKVDIETGIYTPVGKVAGMNNTPIVMVASTAGDLYAIELSSDAFYKIDKKTVEATFIGNTGIQTFYA